ncbi:polysaccharide biosynthesis/export family protein [Pseudomaricurvus sp. HS19]|uniref:polysaccharide biosynthesis/export family protein n=1 Tax=Pseudomaricurvus sp. HS19 TaxID=2692626 RepID=UPI0013696E19|nr:polysaccharide biosynthesis/export family protein [Pseudomaricurvus sp. HS19]MYM65125.1 polysaccharide export protein [Pseudomaricurvus sp. HS19]
MKLLRVSMLLLLTTLAGVSLPVLAQGGFSEYTLGSGDVIGIHVFGESDLSFDEVQLSDAGTLSYPFLGELKLKGLTVGELQHKITKGLLGDYLIDPRVSITIVKYRQFFINGEVEKPGGFPFQPGLTVRKAVSLAEGFTERAAKKNIFIISDNTADQTPVRVELNTPVKPGDIITVEQSFF